MSIGTKRPTFLERLKAETGDAAQHPHLKAQLARLRKGQSWLTNAFAQIADIDGVGGPAVRGFLTAFDFWCDMEKWVRWIFDYEGCVIGPRGCAPGAPVICDHCAQAPEPGKLL